ncbi:hypothetical protein Tco_1092879 [Tanacetum coccineum]|uniref:Uncharacterized protein n=1 Tax=Tanacetum coccineum TaxID=301880 RepID=A0ABQ5ICD3_9ASTR
MVVTTRHLELHNFTPQKTVSIVPLAKKVSKEHYPEGCFWLLIGALLNIIEGFQSEFSMEAQYKELWHHCLITHAYVPREGEDVLYFPQGHLEQVEEDSEQVLLK